MNGGWLIHFTGWFPGWIGANHSAEPKIHQEFIAGGVERGVTAWNLTDTQHVKALNKQCIMYLNVVLNKFHNN